MKKLAFLFVAVAAISFAACCGAKTGTAEGSADTCTVVQEPVVVEEVVATPDSADVATPPAVEEVAE